VSSQNFGRKLSFFNRLPEQVVETGNIDNFVKDFKKTSENLPHGKNTRSVVREFKKKIENVEYPGISKDEVLYFIESFAAFDLDGNGSINEDELKQATESLNMDIDPELVSTMIRGVDLNGQISLLRRWRGEHRRVCQVNDWNPRKDFVHERAQTVKRSIYNCRQRLRRQDWSRRLAPFI
jgi:hypothetical protein